MERHKFNTRTQRQGEQFQSFVADLRILATMCEYSTLKDELILDKIVCGVASSFARKQLLKERDLTLGRAIEIGIVNELSDRDNIELSSSTAVYKDKVHSVGRGKNVVSSKGASKPDVRNCKNCGVDHPAKLKSCPAHVW